jgi:LPXTG-motif cell wall-anchored protein
MAPTSQSADGSGSNAPFWAGLGLVVLIGAAAVYLARRRRAQH